MKRKTMKRFMQTWTLPIAFAVAVTIAALVPALGAVHMARAQPVQPPADPVTVFLAFEKVAFGSSQDIDAAIAMLTDDAMVRVAPPPPGTSGVFTGKEEIRRFLMLAKQQNVKRELTGSPQVDGNRVTAPATVTNNVLEMWGVGPAQFSTEAVVEGGKIKSYASLLSPAEQARVGNAAKAYQAAHAPQAAPAAPAAQQPAGMPRTGTGGQTNWFLAGLLLVIGLSLVIAGAAVRCALASSPQHN